MAFVLVFRVGGEHVVRVHSNLTVLVLALYATACAGAAARSARGRDRVAWTTMTVALATFSLGDAVWAAHVVLHHRAGSFPGLPDFTYLAFTVFAAVALALFPKSSTRPARMRMVLDGVTVALCLFLLFWVISLRPLYESYQSGHVTPVLSLVFAVGDMTVLTTAVLVVLRGTGSRRGVLSRLIVGIALITLTHSAYAVLVAGGRFETATLIDMGWAAALIVFAAAALHSRRPPPAASPPTFSARLWMPYLPLLMAGTVGPLMVMTGSERFLVPLIVTAVCLRQAADAWENRQLLAAASDQASRDPLTGLANHAVFHERLAEAMARRKQVATTVAVVSLDLDDFKLVNDNLGHPVADALLVAVGRRLLARVRPDVTVARVGGDEFLLVLRGSAETAHLVAERMVTAFDEPFTVGGESVPVRPSVGMALLAPDEPDLDPEELVRRADIAMYAAKRSRVPGVHTFTAQMGRTEGDVLEQPKRAGGGAAQVRLLGELRDAVDARALEVVYQPKVELSTGRVVGVEALLRWPHPVHGVLNPDVFLPLVRQHGLMGPVTELVLDKALDGAASWAAAGLRVPVAVNLFPPVLRDSELPEKLALALRRRDLPTDMLTIEITEDVVLGEFGRAAKVLSRVRESGIRVAIDDFGSGFSALAYLRDLPIDEVKLDRHFIGSVACDVKAAAVVRAVIGLGRELGLSVVAEGVEDAETAEWLRDQGCDIAQGYHFAKPMAADGIPELVVGSRHRM